MTDIYAIETSVGTAGLVVREASGFRFYAFVQLFATLENQQYARVDEIHTAVNRLTAAPAKPAKSGRSRKRSSTR